MTDDLTLLERVRSKRDIKAFDELFRRWYGVLVEYASEFVGIVEAENIVQDMMVSLWENARKIQIQSSFRSYVMRSVRNRCLNLILRERTKDKVTSDISESMPLITSATPALENELRALIRDELQKIPSEQRSMFEMNHFEGKTYKEIAEESGVNIRTVEYRISRAIKQLRSGLKDYLA